MSASTEKILVVGPSWVGDMVMSQALYQCLRQSRPGVFIDVLAPGWSAPILQRMPEINRCIAMPLGHGQLGLGKRRRLGRELRSENYDQAILLPNSFKSALVPFFAGIPRRTGWRGEMRYGLLNDLRTLDREVLPLMVQRFAALGFEPGGKLPEPLPTPCLEVDPVRVDYSRAEFGLEPERPVLALCPGAEFGMAKCWPAQYYAELASAYLDKGWQVALYGSDNDRDTCEQVRQVSGRHVLCHNLAGRTSLAQAVDLISLSGAVVSNDSGLMHIAAALRRPLLAIYGATSPGFTPPLSPLAAVVQSELDCAPCFERECPLGHHRCMRDLQPAQVITRLDLLLQGTQ